VAKFALVDAVVIVGGENLSDHIASVSLDVQADDLDTTAFGDLWRNRIGGLKNWSIQLNFHQDFASSEVDATLWPLVGTVAAVSVKATSASPGATNPVYSGDVLVNSYPIFSNSVGDLASVSVTWPGSGALGRATS
jgi:predicted secreted protein